jgi:hypothetical protein
VRLIRLRVLPCFYYCDDVYFLATKLRQFTDVLLLAVEPWGKIGPARDDIEVSSRSKTEGGKGVGEDLWKWTEEQIAPYL